MLEKRTPVLLSSTLTRPNDTTAYSQNDLIASSTTAGSIVVPSMTVPREEAEIIEIVGAFLFTDKTSMTSTVSFHVDLWAATAPTFTNGDNGAYAVATGGAKWIGNISSDVIGARNVFGDGAAVPFSIGNAYANGSSQSIFWTRSPGDKLFWSMFESDATGFTPAALQKFTLSLRGFAQ